MTLDVSAARFAPMRRLLSGEDEGYLIRQGFHREASWLRANHRKCFFRFVDLLERDFGSAHAARKAAMAGNWDFETLLKERIAASYYLFAMRTAGVLHFIHLPQASRLADAYFDRVQPLICVNQFEAAPVPSF
jgi:hypothetical protein